MTTKYKILAICGILAAGAGMWASSAVGSVKRQVRAQNIEMSTINRYGDDLVAGLIDDRETMQAWHACQKSLTKMKGLLDPIDSESLASMISTLGANKLFANRLRKTLGDMDINSCPDPSKYRKLGLKAFGVM